MKFIKKFLESKITKIDFVDDYIIEDYKENTELLSDLEIISDKLQSFHDMGFDRIGIREYSNYKFIIDIDSHDYIKSENKLEEVKLINNFISIIIELYNLLDDLNLKPKIENKSTIDASDGLDRTNINYILTFKKD